MHNIEIPHKNKSLSLFHINSCTLNKNFDDIHHLLSHTKKTFYIIAISQVKLESQNKYLYQIIWILIIIILNLLQLRLMQVVPFFNLLIIIYHINVVMI